MSIKRQPAVLDGRPRNDPLREFYRKTSKASLFDALCDRVALQHPESVDDAILDSDWMCDKLAAVLGTAGCAKRHAERTAAPHPVRVELPPPRVEGFGEMLHRIGDGSGGHARIDPNPTIAPGTIRREAAVCEKCGLRYDAKFDDDEGEPLTQKPWTCDDCGGSVEVK